MKGRKPKSRRERELQGNPGKRPLPPMVEFGPVSAEPPAYLDPEAQEVWREYAPLLALKGYLTAADALKFAGLCTVAGRLRQFAEHYRRSAGPIVVSVATQMDPDGGGAQHASAKPNPLLNLEAKYLVLVDRFGSSFGLDPAARARLKPSGPETKRSWFDDAVADRPSLEEVH